MTARRPRKTRPRRWTRWLIAGAVTLAAAVVFHALMLRHNPMFFDLKIYMSGTRWWLAGNDLFDYSQPDRVQGELFFTYPPFTALLFVPFAALPQPVAELLFVLGTLAAVVVTTCWLARPIASRLRWPLWYTTALAVPLILVMEPLRETLTLGQLNLLLVVLILADLLILLPRGSRWAGAAIGIATAIKLLPGIFIVYLLVTKRWRAAIVAMGSAAVVTLVTAVIAPRASWQFWTGALWDTERVGRTDYTGNQSLLGVLSRMTAPEAPSRLIWIILVVIVGGYGLWRAARAARAGQEVAGLALAGLVGSLISPITWPHHLYWFVPALVAIVCAAISERRRLRRAALWGLAIGAYAVSVLGVVSLVDWGTAAQPTDTVPAFLARNAFALLSLILLLTLPTRPGLSHSSGELDSLVRSEPIR